MGRDLLVHRGYCATAQDKHACIIRFSSSHRIIWLASERLPSFHLHCSSEKEAVATRRCRVIPLLVARWSSPLPGPIFLFRRFRSSAELLNATPKTVPLGMERSGEIASTVHKRLRDPRTRNEKAGHKPCFTSDSSRIHLLVGKKADCARMFHVKHCRSLNTRRASASSAPP